jgi:hypothetical protein
MGAFEQMNIACHGTLQDSVNACSLTGTVQKWSLPIRERRARTLRYKRVGLPSCLNLLRSGAAAMKPDENQYLIYSSQTPPLR